MKIAEEQDWPWTSDKAFVSCVVCGVGVLVKFADVMGDEPCFCVHRLCLGHLQSDDAAARKPE